jgi:hypothetical protein
MEPRTASGLLSGVHDGVCSEQIRVRCEDKRTGKRNSSVKPTTNISI